MKKLVSETISQILKPKSKEDVTAEFQRRIDLIKGKEVRKEGKNFIIYQVKKAEDIKELVRNMGGRDEDIFFNFYLILDKDALGFLQCIGIKVSPDGTINAMDAKGTRVEADYLDKFS